MGMRYSGSASLSVSCSNRANAGHERKAHMTTRLLLVEDEIRMAEAIQELLSQEGYEVDHFPDGELGLVALESDLYDVCVLDLMLPKMDGLEVARNARKAGIKTPILMLTAKGDLTDKVIGLDAGADDYMTKPFMTEELLARLRALTRRGTNAVDGTLVFGDIVLDTSNMNLSCPTTGESVRLSDKEFKIMEYMITNKGIILTREQLAMKIWGFDNDAEYNNVEVYMSFTRKKLAFVGSKAKIKAVRGVGYELRYDVGKA